MIRKRRQLQGELKTLRPLGICRSDGLHHRVVESPLSVHLRKTWTLLPFELLSHCGQVALRNRGRERERLSERVKRITSSPPALSVLFTAAAQVLCKMIVLTGGRGGGCLVHRLGCGAAHMLDGNLDSVCGCAGAQPQVMQQAGQAEPAGTVVTTVCVIHCVMRQQLSALPPLCMYTHHA